MGNVSLVVGLLVVLSLGLIGGASMLALWLTGDPVVFGLVLVPAGAVAALLVGFFMWRDELRRQPG